MATGLTREGAGFALRTGAFAARWAPGEAEGRVRIVHEPWPAFAVGTRLANGLDLDLTAAEASPRIEALDGRLGVAVRAARGWADLEGVLEAFPDAPGLFHWRVTARVRADKAFDRKGWETPDAEFLVADRRRSHPVTRYVVPRGPATGALFFHDHAMRCSALYLEDFTPLADLYALSGYANPFQIDDDLHPSAVRMGRPPVEFQPAEIDGQPNPPVPWTPLVERFEEFGYARPSGVRLRAGTAIVLADTWLALEPGRAPDATGFCARYLAALAKVYARLAKPAPLETDWAGTVAPGMARQILEEPRSWGEHEGVPLVRAYVKAAGRPGAGTELITLTDLLLPLVDYTRLRPGCREAADLRARLERGLPLFWNAAWGGFFNGIGKPATLSGWYFFWNVLNLCDLAESGNADARRMVLASRDRLVDLGVRCDYAWAMLDSDTCAQKHFYNFEVAGVYAYIMTSLYELGGRRDAALLAHAEAAARKLAERGLDLVYELNGAAAGAVACERLWRLTGDAGWRGLADVPLANTLRWALLWEGGYGAGRHARTFWAFCPTPGNHNLAEHESHHARRFLRQYRTLARDRLDAALDAMLRDSLVHGQSQSRFALPPYLAAAGGAWTMAAPGPSETLCGEIDHGSWVPLEDVHVGWCTDDQWFKPNPRNGVVGQEIYGAGGPVWYAVLQALGELDGGDGRR